MSYSHEIKQTLKKFNGDLYKVILLKVTNTDGTYQNSALPLNIEVDDGVNNKRSFLLEISNNQKELLAYFTIDAFTSFSNSSSVNFGYGSELNETIPDVDVQTVTPILTLFSSVPHTDATDAWLATL